jgi:intracellular sulfur oxidation DsrE/DsrF family protein
MTRTLTPLLAALLLATAPMAHASPMEKSAVEAAAPAASEEIKVVYHVNDSANATAALRNINNHLNASPGVHIVVVTHSKGIDFLLNDAQDKNGNPYEPIVQGLKDRGVEFRVCNNTLKGRKLDASAVIPEATIVPSGVAEIARLEAKEGYVYLKP